VSGSTVRSAGWRLRGGETWPPAAFSAWHGLWEGFAALHGTGSLLEGHLDRDGYEWVVRGSPS